MPEYWLKNPTPTFPIREGGITGGFFLYVFSFGVGRLVIHIAEALFSIDLSDVIFFFSFPFGEGGDGVFRGLDATP